MVNHRVPTALLSTLRALPLSADAADAPRVLSGDPVTCSVSRSQPASRKLWLRCILPSAQRSRRTCLNTLFGEERRWSRASPTPQAVKG
jgi:hypothetical protein